jgi:glycerophosphoryl diester phosphodiesterase
MNLLLYILMLVLLLALWQYVLWRPRPLPGLTRRPPLLLGHRGVRGSLKENTLQAFRAALDAGLDGIEFDVQRSRDGQLVIYHDFDLPDGRAVASLTFAQLKAFDADMPTVDELFALAADYPGTLLNLEIKARMVRTNGLEHLVAQAILTSGLLDRVIVSSFNPGSLLKLWVHAPSVRRALLFAPDLPAWLRHGWLGPFLHVDALHPHHSQVTTEMLAWAHRRGVMVNTWTVNDAARVQALLALGVDGVMADDPVALMRAGGRE